jgi:hypothetical protein
MKDRIDRLKGAFACELERQVEELFEHAVPLSPYLSETPVIGGEFVTRLGSAGLLSIVCGALVAREIFRQKNPDWPNLPLHQKDCARMMSSDDNRNKLVGFFGASLRESKYDTTVHPAFETFVSGLLCYEYAPRALLSDCQLRQEFPPQRLPGLCDGWLAWRDSETLAAHRYHRLRPPRIRLEVIQGLPSGCPP